MSPRIALILALLVGIFVLDTVTDFEIALAVFYVSVILLAVGSLSSRNVIILTVACVALAVLSFVLTSSGSHEAGLVNLAISISAIGITTYLALKIVAAEVAVLEAHGNLTRMARLTSLGALTDSITREVGEPLAAIVSKGDACRQWLDADPPDLGEAGRTIDQIIADAKRAGEVIERVRALAGGEMPQSSLIDLNALIAESVALTRREIDRADISLNMSLAEDLPAIAADKIQLQQVIANLILNAIEAMSGVPAGQRSLDILSARDTSGSAIVSVGDTGPGVRADSLDHIFEAFRTTKEGSAGIGLTISRSIIEASGGSLWAFSREPAGAVFQFSLPAGDVRPV